MKFQLLCLLSCLLLSSLLPFAVLAEGQPEVHVDGKVQRDINRKSGEAGVQKDMREEAREEKRQFKSLWRQLSYEEREALRQQMRAAWQHLTPEERQRALAKVEHPEENAAQGAQGIIHEKHREMRGNNSIGINKERDPKDHNAEHKAYWDSLSVEERAVLRENLRANLREILRQRCQSQQNAEDKGQGLEIDCSKALNNY